MPNEILEAEQAQAQAPAQKAKPKNERINIKLTGAASCMIDDIAYKKGTVFNIDSNKAERFLSTGLFERI